MESHLRPSQNRPADGGTFCDDCTVIDSTARLMQCVAKDCEKDDWRNHTLEREEILDLGVRYAEEWKLQQEVQ